MRPPFISATLSRSRRKCSSVSTSSAMISSRVFLFLIVVLPEQDEHVFDVASDVEQHLEEYLLVSRIHPDTVAAGAWIRKLSQVDSVGPEIRRAGCAFVQLVQPAFRSWGC